MAERLRANKQINGTFGSIWVNNEKWLDIESFEAKASIEYDDVNMAGDLATHKKMLGWEGEGTIVVKKVYSRGANLLGDALKSGIVPETNIVAKLDDPDAHGAERVSFDEVTFNELALASFEMKTLATEEIPFNFASYEYIDVIEA